MSQDYQSQTVSISENIEQFFDKYLFNIYATKLNSLLCVSYQGTLFAASLSCLFDLENLNLNLMNFVTRLLYILVTTE